MRVCASTPRQRPFVCPPHPPGWLCSGIVDPCARQNTPTAYASSSCIFRKLTRCSPPPLAVRAAFVPIIASASRPNRLRGGSGSRPRSDALMSSVRALSHEHCAPQERNMTQPHDVDAPSAVAICATAASSSRDTGALKQATHAARRRRSFSCGVAMLVLSAVAASLRLSAAAATVRDAALARGHGWRAAVAARSRLRDGAVWAGAWAELFPKGRPKTPTARAPVALQARMVAKRVLSMRMLPSHLP